MIDEVDRASNYEVFITEAVITYGRKAEATA